MEFDILSLFPDYFAGPFDESMLKRARVKGLLTIRCHNIRDFAKLKNRRVDDSCYGGGPGMVLMAEPVRDAILSVKRATSHVIYLTPQGKPLTAKRSRELAQKEHVILLCGHYEGIDERAMAYVDEELSIGDYVLTNGGAAAIVVVDAVSRFVPGVIGDERAASQDSFETGLLDCPHYTKPALFEGKGVPEVLLNGNHKEIDKWRYEEAYKKTARVRPELLKVGEKP